MKFISAFDAAKFVRSNHRIFVHSAASTPTILTKAITERAEELSNVEFCHIHTMKEVPYAAASLSKSFKINSLFVGDNVRHTLQSTNSVYTPVFLSECGDLFRKSILPVDIALIQISVPDENGFCTLGLSVDISKAAVDAAKLVIAQVNTHMPKVHGDGLLHVSEIDYFVEHHEPVFSVAPLPISEAEEKIASNVANLIENGSTLQMGIGSIPDAVLSKLTHHKNLGLHTEMFTDGVMELIKKGVLNGTEKKLIPRKAVSSFLIGSQELYDFVDDNPYIYLKEASFTNDPFLIMQNPKVVSINSAIEVDLTGQVCADSIGPRIYSGVGGQVDFIYGTSRSKEGKAIVALTSVSNKGINKIVPFLKKGAGVVTTRAHIRYIVTEYGVADLYAKSIDERVKAMASIAHPDFRETILKEYYDAL